MRNMSANKLEQSVLLPATVVGGVDSIRTIGFIRRNVEDRHIPERSTYAIRLLPV